jgi:hypothetical protein
MGWHGEIFWSCGDFEAFEEIKRMEKTRNPQFAATFQNLKSNGKGKW